MPSSVVVVVRVALACFLTSIATPGFASSPFPTIPSPTFAEFSFEDPVPPPISPPPVRLTIPEVRAAAGPALRPRALPVLYGSLGVLHVLDAVTTVRGLRHGAVEINPVIRPVADHGGALLAVKAGSTAASIFLTEKLWKRDRAVAIATMIGINAAMAFVVVHNHGVVRRLR